MRTALLGVLCGCNGAAVAPSDAAVGGETVRFDDAGGAVDSAARTDLCDAALEVGDRCVVDLSACAESEKGPAWRGMDFLEGTVGRFDYANKSGLMCSIDFSDATTSGSRQQWPVIPEAGWWCGTVLAVCEHVQRPDAGSVDSGSRADAVGGGMNADICETELETGDPCVVVLSSCAESEKADAWKGRSVLEGTIIFAYYTNTSRLMCSVSVPTPTFPEASQSWPVTPEPGWWCGTVAPLCAYAPPVGGE